MKGYRKDAYGDYVPGKKSTKRTNFSLEDFSVLRDNGWNCRLFVAKPFFTDPLTGIEHETEEALKIARERHSR
jgi:hypothetical protein